MAVPPEIPLRELLREARIAALRFARRRRSIKAAMDMEEAWVRYYERKYALTKHPKDYEMLRLHREKLEMYQARMEIFRLAGRYARTRDPEDLLRLRLAQARYYREKVEALEIEKPEEAERVKRRYLPPPELYEEWLKALEEIERIEEAIESACRAYKEAIATGTWFLLSPTERYRRTRAMQRLFIERYETAREAAEIERTLPEIVEEYRRLLEQG